MSQNLKKKVSASFSWQRLFCFPFMNDKVAPSILPKISDARILIIEDEPVSLKLLSRYISDIAGNKKDNRATWESTHINSTDNGEVALSMFASAQNDHPPFDILFIDNTLTRTLKGFEVAVELRKRGYNGPIAMVTSADPDEFAWSEKNDTSIYGLKLTEVIQDGSLWKLETISPDRYGSKITKLAHEAYLVPKPAAKDSLATIIKAHFIVPEAKKTIFPTVPPNILFLHSLKPSWTHESLATDPDWHFQTHLSMIVRDLETRFPTEDVPSSAIPTVTFGNISPDASQQHIYASAMTQLQNAAETANTDTRWARNCLAIARAALTQLRQFSTLTEKIDNK